MILCWLRKFNTHQKKRRSRLFNACNFSRSWFGKSKWLKKYNSIRAQRTLTGSLWHFAVKRRLQLALHHQTSEDFIVCDVSKNNQINSSREKHLLFGYFSGRYAHWLVCSQTLQRIWAKGADSPLKTIGLQLRHRYLKIRRAWLKSYCCTVYEISFQSL